MSPIERRPLPGQRDRLYLCHTGLETDLIFNHGVDLPGFAAFPLLDSPDGRATLARYYDDLIELVARQNVGLVMESVTWMANKDRAADLGYGPEDLRRLNREAIALMAEARNKSGYGPLVLSANIGPRSDAYTATGGMSVSEATDYHAEQISCLATTSVDVASGFTLAYVDEAIGLAIAAREHGLPCAIAFTVETDGRLPSGVALGDAIEQVDDATGRSPAYYMVNCAHPDHFAKTLKPSPWMDRIQGVIANASRCSHAELDAAEELDDGDPEELGHQLAALRGKFPHLSILGGCCGTDFRHLEEILARSR